MKNNKIKILIPLLIVAVIAGMWFFKQQQEAEQIEADSQLTESLADENFALTATSIDLDVLSEYGLPIMIDFGADSCVPCKEMAPVLVTLNAEMQEKAIVKFVDVWKNPEAATDFPVQVIPTQIIINADGTPYVPSENMDIEFIMYATQDTEEHVYTAHQGGLTEEQMRAILADMGVE
ncbi:MAG: thioredoxin family protein [Eubacteriales bacterium]